MEENRDRFYARYRLRETMVILYLSSPSSQLLVPTHNFWRPIWSTHWTAMWQIVSFKSFLTHNKWMPGMVKFSPIFAPETFKSQLREVYLYTAIICDFSPMVPLLDCHSSILLSVAKHWWNPDEWKGPAEMTFAYITVTIAWISHFWLLWNENRNSLLSRCQTCVASVLSFEKPERKVLLVSSGLFIPGDIKDP